MMFRAYPLIAVFAALLALIAPASAPAQDFPALSGRVVDAANIIPEDREAAISAKLEALEQQTSRQLVVATIPDLQGYPVEDYGYRLGRAWKIGQAKANNGALLIVAPNDRKARIEVGYGLEPILTDALTSVIMQTQMIPLFKQNDYPGGIEAGADAIIEQLRLPPEEAERRAAEAARNAASSQDIGAVIFWLFIFFFFVVPFILPILFGRRRGRRFGAGPVIIWGGGSDWSGGGGGGWGGGGFSGGGGSFGGGGSSGSW